MAGQEHPTVSAWSYDQEVMGLHVNGYNTTAYWVPAPYCLHISLKNMHVHQDRLGPRLRAEYFARPEQDWTDLGQNLSPRDDPRVKLAQMRWDPVELPKAWVDDVARYHQEKRDTEARLAEWNKRLEREGRQIQGLGEEVETPMPFPPFDEQSFEEEILAWARQREHPMQDQ